MPTYRVTAPDGRTVRLTGDSPPTEQELEEIFATLPAAAAQPAAPSAADRNTSPSTIGPLPWYQKDIVGGVSVQDAIGALPAVGGFVGGVLGGGAGLAGGTAAAGPPGGAAVSVKGALGGAALGGAAGEAFRQHGMRAIGAKAPTSGTEAAQQIATEGAVQGVAELGGLGAAAAVRGIGKALVENAVRPSISLRREFPDVIDTVIRERIPVGARPFGKEKGSGKAAVLLAEESHAVRQLLAQATQRGQTFDRVGLAQPVIKLIDDIEQQANSGADLKRVTDMVYEFLAKDGGRNMTPLAVQKLKQKSQAIAKPIYRAVAAGNPVSAAQAMKARFNEAIASGSKKAMETIPGVATKEARKRSLIGAERAVSQAEMRRLSLMAEVASGAMGVGAGNQVIPLDSPFQKSVAGWLITRGVLSPRSMSRVGLTLTRAEMAAVTRQFPRLAAELFKGTTGEETPERAGQ